MRFLLIPGISLFLLAFTPQPVSAAQAINMELDVDGKSIAGFTRTYDGEPPKEIWAMLKRVPLTFNPAYTLPLENADATNVTLTGTITMQQTRSGEVQARAKIDHLQLVKRAGEWYVANSEVDRTMKTAGIAGLSFDLQDIGTEGMGQTLQHVAIGMAAFVLILLLLSALGKNSKKAAE